MSRPGDKYYEVGRFGRESYEAIRQAVPVGDILHFAKAMGISQSMFEKWTRPYKSEHGSGSRNPLDRIEIIIRTAFNRQMPQADALAPLHWLAGQFRHVVVPLPDMEISTTKDHTQEILRALKEFGEFTSAYSRALEDGELTARECEGILQELQDAQTALAGCGMLVLLHRQKLEDEG